MTPPDLSLILIMILFWVTFWMVQRFLIRPVGSVIAERRGRVESAEREYRSKHDDFVSATERLRNELDDAARDAATVRAAHRDAANRARQEALETARADADRRLDGALSDLAVEAEAARAELRRHAQELSRLFAEQLLGREVRS